jgi:phosphorylcholine metabolism protein LicD
MKTDIDYSQYSPLYKACLMIANLIGKPISDKRKYAWYLKVSSIGNKKNTKYITGYNDAFGLLSLRYTGKLFDAIIDHRFEDTVFPITAQYDNYLKTQYGDYMTPPEEDERVPHFTI